MLIWFYTRLYEIRIHLKTVICQYMPSDIPSTLNSPVVIIANLFFK